MRGLTSLTFLNTLYLFFFLNLSVDQNLIDAQNVKYVLAFKKVNRQMETFWLFSLIFKHVSGLCGLCVITAMLKITLLQSVFNMPDCVRER